VAALVRKEMMELRRNPALLLPLVLLALVAVALPFLMAVVVPAFGGESLTESGELDDAVELARRHIPALANLQAEQAAQVFIFQQFLLFFVLVPVTGSVALAAYSVVGEKQNRTLEPLLATPLTTLELVLSKVLAAALPALATEAIALGLYFAVVWILLDPAVLTALLTTHTLLIVGVIGPLASLTALQVSLIASSRVNDPRTAQQIAVFVILPIVAVVVGQFAGVFFLTTGLTILVAIGFAIAWIFALLLSVAVFDREQILTRWK
jgi:ABC-2 type transport system permease protein